MKHILRKIAPKVSWTILSCIFIGFVISVYMMFIVMNNRYKGHVKWYELSAPCVQPQKTIDAMVSLSFTASEILEELNVPYTLCYGTLWGALRNGHILPWDNNVDVSKICRNIDYNECSIIRHNTLSDYELSDY